MRALDLFAAQVWVDASTYRSEASFRHAIASSVARCQERRARGEDGRPDAPAIVVFPEHIGSFLSLALLGRLGALMPSTDVGMVAGLFRRPTSFLRALRGARGGARSAALIALAEEARPVYERVFSEIAKGAEMTIVAGSTLLADRERAHVYNASLTFGPDGRCLGETRKVNLVPEIEDGLGLSAGDPEALAPVEVEGTRLGTLICYDGFAVPHTSREPGWRPVGGRLAERGAEVVAQPSANPWPWEDRWVHAPPSSNMRRREQWRCEGLATQLEGMAGVHFAVTAHLVGKILDQRFEGRSEILGRDADGDVTILARAPSARCARDAEAVVHARVELG